MRYHRDKTLRDEAMQELALLLKGALDAADVKCLQCIYFRSKGLGVEEISYLVQYSVGHVKRVWSSISKRGHLRS